MRKLVFSANKYKATKWKPKYQIFKTHVEINPFDDDAFPSVPHADSINHHYKIDLLDGKGTVYNSKRKKVATLDKKEYRRLINDTERLGLFKISREYYREHHPHENLPIVNQETIATRKQHFYLRKIIVKNQISKGCKTIVFPYKLKIVELL